WNHHDRHAAFADRLADRNFERPRHLVGARDEIAVVAAFAEQVLRMSFLKVAGADLGRRNLRRDREHRHARPVAIEESVDQVQITWPATAGADRQFARQMRLGARGESGDLLVSDVHPLDLSLAADRIGQTIQAIADDAVDALDAGRREGLGELIGYGLRHPSLSCRDDLRKARAPYDLRVAQSSRRDEFGFNRLGVGMRHRAASPIMVKHEPWFSVERTSTRCPSRSAACLTMKSPRPRPSSRVSSARCKALKIVGSWPAGMPL